jgi:iron complex outermembrane recepter protein
VTVILEDSSRKEMVVWFTSAQVFVLTQGQKVPTDSRRAKHLKTSGFYAAGSEASAGVVHTLQAGENVCIRAANQKTIPAQALKSLRYTRLSALALVSTCPAAWGQTQQAEPRSQGRDLTQVSIENLMNMEVTSASKKDQKMSQVAAAIFVISQEDIRRSGAVNIPDLLRMVPGLDVAQINGSTWAISARGFNAQYSNKLLVMVDGRIVYTPTFAGVYWDALDLPLNDIERIEVIRGPGGTIWGANAVNGVISIFTKKAGDTRGGLIEAGAGTTEQGFTTVQYGGKLSKSTDYRVYTKYFNRDHMLDLTGQSGADGWHMLRSGFRSDSVLSSKDTLSTEGNLYAGREGELGFVLPSVTSAGFVAIPEQINLGGGSLQSTWNHVYSERSDSSLQASFTRYTRNDPVAPETRDTLDVDYQYHTAWGNRQDIVWGLGYQYTTDTINGSFTGSFNPPSRSLQVFNSFVQDEIGLIPSHLYLTAGTKLEHNDYTGIEAMPSVRLTWAPSDRHMFWSAVSRAIRAPSRGDTNLVVNIGGFPNPAGPPTLLRFRGNPAFRNETLLAYEIGYRTVIAERFSIDLASYFNHYGDVQTTEPSALFFESTPLPAHEVELLTYQNLMHGETHGVEIAANFRVTDRWTVSPAYALEQLHMHTDPTSADLVTPLFIERGAPRHSAQLRSHTSLRRDLTWDVSAYFVDRLSNQGPSTLEVIPAYTRLDTGLTWRLRERFSLSLVGQNLLKDHHVEFQDVFGSMQSGQIKRSAYAKVVWQF